MLPVSWLEQGISTITVIRDVEIKNDQGILGLPFLRLPIEAWLLKPISLLPFKTARVSWFVISVIAAMSCVVLWPTGTITTRAALAAWFLPFTNVVICGQDAVFFLAKLTTCVAHPCLFASICKTETRSTVEVPPGQGD